MSNTYISPEERIERLNAVRHEIAQHFNEGFAWIDQILSEEIEQIDLEERRTRGINTTTIDDGNWNGYAIPHDEGCEFVADSVSKKEILLAFIDKGQNSKRYNWGDTWELNASEIREVLDSLPTSKIDKQMAYWYDGCVESLCVLRYNTYNDETDTNGQREGRYVEMDFSKREVAY